MNIANLRQRERMYRAIETAYNNLVTYRRDKRELVRSYIGVDFGRRTNLSNKGPLPQVNLMYQVAEAYQIALAYNLPRFQLKTSIGAHKAFAKRIQTALNSLAKHIKLHNELAPCVLDAFFRAGIFKVYLPDSLPVMTDTAPYMEEDMPFGSRVSGDSWVHDTGATDIRQAGFMGDMYTVRLEDAKNSGLWGSDFSRQLVPREHNQEEDHEKASGLGRQLYDNQTEIDDMVDLCDIYLPRERMIVTLPCDTRFRIKASAKPFVREWDGLPCGPYHLLTFADVPDNAMPLSLAGNLYGLTVLYNNLLAKLSYRAMQQKDLFLYSSGTAQDVQRITYARDLDQVRVDSKDAYQTLKLGGIDGALMAFDMNVMEIFNRSAGNIDTMLGLGPVAPTASQEAQIGQAVQGRLAKLRQRTNQFVSSIGSGLAELIYDAPELTIPGRRTLGNGYDVDDSWFPPHLLPRQGQLSDYDIEVEPYSMEYRSPQQTLGILDANLARIAPLMPMLEAQGTTFDGATFIRKIAELSDSPELVEMFQFGGLPMDQGEGGQTRVGANQPREYIRKNVSAGATSQGRQHQQMQAMLSMNSSDSE